MNQITVLIVEDESIVAADLTSKLTRMGYEVVGVATEGAEAVALAGHRRPQVVLMDICLKGAMDGIEAAHELRTRHDLPVIYLTAHSDPATLARAKFSEPFGYILKPFQDRELATHIEVAVYKHQAERALRESEVRYRNLFNSMSEGFALHELISDSAGRPYDYCFLEANPAFERLTGLRATDIVGRTARAVLPEIEPVWIERYGRVVLTGEPDHFESWSQSLGRWYEVHASRTAPGRFAAVFLDVTERKLVREALQRAHDELELRVEQRTRDLQDAILQLKAEADRRSRIEAELRESEERYRVLLSAAPIGIGLSDSSGRVHEANTALCGMLGVTASEAQAASAVSFYARPSDRRRLLSRVRRESPVVDFETTLRRKDGTEFPALVGMNLIQMHRQQYFLTIVTDLTKRRQTERHMQGVSAVHELFATKTTRDDYLEAVVQLLRQTCACACAGIRLLDHQGRLPFAVSAGFSRQFLKAEGDLIIETHPCPCFLRWNGMTPPADPPCSMVGGTILCEELDRQATTGKHERVALPCANSGYESVVMTRIRYRGRVIGAIHLASRESGKFRLDTMQFLDSVAPLLGEALHRFGIESELRESEARFRTMFEHHQAVMLLIDPESDTIVDANEAAAQFYGYPRSQLSALSIMDLITPPLPRVRRRPVRRGLGGSKDMLSENKVSSHRLASGEIRAIEVHSSPVTVGERKLLFSIIHDISERRHLERQVLDAGDLERRRIGRDLHDSLGGSLSGLALVGKALAQTLARGRPKEAALADEIVQGINEAVGRTRSIARGLCPVGLSAFGFVSGLEELARNVEKRHRVRCQIRASEEVKIEDEPVASHLYLIVEEAVNNAVRHSQARQIEIAVDHGPARLSVTVRDDGVGMPKDVQRSPGMGLRTMRYRADVIGARLEIQSLANDGTVVTCVMPLAHAAQARSTATPPSE